MFIQENRTKLKLEAGQPVYGVLSTSDDPQMAELFGLAGFDFYMLDAEHGLMASHEVVNVIRACERVNTSPMVRIGPKDPKLVLQYLDAGMMGVMMPGLDGYQVCVELRQQSSVPVILLTSLDNADEIVHGFSVGADDYITKPFQFRDLEVRIQALLRRATPHSP